VSKDRVTRPEPARTQPIRSWTGALFGLSPPAGGGDRPEAGPLEDVVARSVELGYRVVDDYLREGQRVAERMGGGGFRADALVGDVQQLTARMARYASDFMEVWFQFVELATAGSIFRRDPGALGGQPAPNGAPRPEPAPAAAAQPPAGRVRLAVDASQPTEVALDLRADAAGRRLVVQSLRATDHLPRLTEVALASDGDGPVLRIRVPPGHPAGVYHGVVVDEQTNTPAGTLSVRVGGTG
jgi:hypothetical protein